MKPSEYLSLNQFPRQVSRIALVIAAICAMLATNACKEDDDQTALFGAALNAVQSSTSGNGNNSGNSGGSTTPTCATTGHCMIFVTTVNATTNGGIAGLDANCAAETTNKPSGGGTYKAIVADGTNRIACTTANCSGGTSEHTDWVLKPSKEYRRKDGTTVIGTTTANGVFSFPLTATIETTTVGTNSVRTGLETDWTSSTNDCSNWSDNTAGVSSTQGLHDQTSNAAIRIGTSGCSNVAKVYCAEQ